ncbi:MAG: PEP-CTERM sorting domain-containing protein [Gemmatimonadaceae bacterium]
MIRKLLIKAALVAAIAAPLLGAQVTIDTGSPGSADVVPVGKYSDFVVPIPTAVAQTFAQPTGFNYLQMFTFFISDGFGGGANLLLQASVVEYTTSPLAGTLLYTAALNGSASPTNEAVTFGSGENPLNLFLDPTKTYALVLSSLEHFAATPDHSTITVGGTGDVYSGGSLFATTATDIADIDATNSLDLGQDAAFSATFTSARVTPTPEPSTTVLFATGLIGVATMVKRRRRV